MKWVGHVAGKREVRIAYKILIRKPEGIDQSEENLRVP
jgi:hypothetical protein